MDPMLMLMMLQQQQQQQQQQNTLMSAFQRPPLFGGVQMPVSPMFSFGAESQFGQIGQMALQAILPAIMGPEFMPGQFSPTRNIADHYRSMKYMQDQRAAMSIAGQADQNTYFKMIRGFARMRGIEYEPGSEQEKSAQRFAGDISTISEYLEPMMPELFDKLHGIKGSAKGFTRGMFEGGRYRFDPITGRAGMEGKNVGEITRQIYELLYGEGADIGQMKGIGAGSAGQLYDELVRRGHGPMAALDRNDQISMMARQKAQSLGIGDDKQAIAKLEEDFKQMNPRALESAVQSFDAKRSADMIKKMSGAVAAMRDIFGDMGRPNAPMMELINGLQALTQGGLNYMRPDQIEKSVRMTYALSNITGLGLEKMMGLAGMTNQMLQQAGMSTAFAVPISQQSAAFAHGYGQSGTPRTFGAFDKEEAMQMDARLRVQAASSPQAVRLGALMHLADQHMRENPLFGSRTGFAQNTEAYALSEAIRAGKNEYEFGGQVKSVYTSQQQMVEILVSSGIDRNEAMQLVTRPSGAAAESIHKYNIQDRVREGQMQIDVSRDFNRVMERGVTVSLGARKDLSNKEKVELSRIIGPMIHEEATKLFQENPEIFEDPAKRNMEIAKRVKARLGAQGSKISEVEMANIVRNAMGSAEDFIHQRGGSYQGARSYTNVLALHNKRAMQLGARAIGDAKGIAALQSALAGVGQAGFLQRISDYTQGIAAGGGTLTEFIFTALGGKQTNEVANAAAALIERVMELQEKYDSTTDEAERARIMQEIQMLKPDVNNALEGKLDKLTPEAKKRIDDYRKTDRGKLTERKLTPEQKKFNAALATYREAQEKVLGEEESYKKAKQAVDVAKGTAFEGLAERSLEQVGKDLAEKVAGNEDVKKAKKAVDEAFEALPEVQKIKKQQAGQNQANTVALASNEVRMTAQTVIIQKVGKDNVVDIVKDTATAAAALGNGDGSTRITGTVRLEGLDQLVMETVRMIQGDPRGV